MPNLSAPDALIPAVARWIVTMLGAALVHQGITVSGDQSTALLGGVTVLLGLGWSVYNKYVVSHRINVALALPPNSTRADVERNVALQAAGTAPVVPPQV